MRLKWAPCFQRHTRLKRGCRVDYPKMVIDMSDATLEVIEQFWEVLVGTADTSSTIANDQATLSAFVTVLRKRSRYFKLSKGHRGVVTLYRQRLSGGSR